MEKKQIEDMAYTNDPSVYLRRALKAQSDKIENQTIQLARMNRVIKLVASNMTIRDVLFLLVKVIISKVK